MFETFWQETSEVKLQYYFFRIVFSHHNLHGTVDIVRGNDVICEVSLDRHTSLNSKSSMLSANLFPECSVTRSKQCDVRESVRVKCNNFNAPPKNS